MPSMSDRALLMELNVLMVENHIRRGVLSVAANIQASEQEVIERSKTIQPNESWTFESLDVNKGTIIRAQNGPINATITKGLETWTTVINSLFVVTDELGDIVFSNPNTATKAVLVRVIQT